MSVQKALDRIKALVEAGSFYEAQQAYKSTYYRQRARKQLAEAYTILKEGAAQQLHNGNVTCGVELGLLLLEAYAEDDVPTTGSEAAVQTLCNLIAVFPPPPPLAAQHASAAGAVAAGEAGAGPGGAPGAAAAQEGAAGAGANGAGGEGAGPSGGAEQPGQRGDTTIRETSRFVTAAVKWAQRRSDLPATQQIHAAYARWLWDTCDLRHVGLAVTHFARGADPASLNEVLKSCASRGRPEEAPLFLARGVLAVLAAGHRRTPGLPQQQLRGAEALLKAGSEWCPADAPLVHFLELLMQALRLRSVPLTRLLSERYSPSFEVDPGLAVLLNKAASAYGVLGKRRGGGGMPFGGGLLGSLMQQMGGFGPMDEDSTEESEGY